MGNLSPYSRANLGPVKIVTHTDDLLRFEHRSWRASLIGAGQYLFLASGVSMADDLMVHQTFFAVLFCGAFAAFSLLVAETSRVTFDLRRGTVLIFRKTAFRTARLTLPLADLEGVFLQRSHYNHGWHSRPALVFDDGATVLVIPACRNGARPAPRAVVDFINEWLGTDPGEAKRAAAQVWPEPKTELEHLGAYLKRRLGG